MGKKKIIISFAGTNYHGWQVQNNALTVQEVLQNAVEKMFSKRLDITGCSRTDAGVHANNFCCHFDTNANISNIGIVKGLNTLLPNDICVKSCEDVADDFHARYSATKKQYVYKIHNSSIRNPFLDNLALRYDRDLKLDDINEFCKNIIGTYDFYGFSSSGRTVTDTVRTIYDCNFTKDGDICLFTVTGNGFLYNMVRILVGTALYVSEGKIDPKATKDIILSKDRSLAGPTVSPCGLYLNQVYYE